jgi:hypothetical protein
MFQKVWRNGVLAFVGIMLIRAFVFDGGGTEDTAPPVPDGTQHIVLQADGSEGTEIPFAIQRLNVYLVEDEEYPESFEFEGEGIKLVGKFPVSLHVGYDENWQVLVGKPIAFSRTSDVLDAPSQIELPNEAPCPVTGGAFTIQEVGEGVDAKTPLTGELWLRCSTPDGERILRGTFNVKGTTWG